MSQQLIAEITREYLKNDLPEFRPGDTVKVYVKIVEGEYKNIKITTPDDIGIAEYYLEKGENK